MCRARKILPRKIYLLTRPVRSGSFFYVQRVVHYYLCYAAQKYGIQRHAFFAMSNHFRAVVTEANSVLPKVMHSLDRNSSQPLIADTNSDPKINVGRAQKVGYRSSSAAWHMALSLRYASSKSIGFCTEGAKPQSGCKVMRSLSTYCIASFTRSTTASGLSTSGSQ